MTPALCLHLKKLILWAAPLAGLACGGEGGTDVVLPSLRITTTTSGVEIDPDGYSVSIDGQAAQPIGVDATVTVDRLAEGQHTVELSGIAANCAVGGDNPQSADVAPGATASVGFVVTCSPQTGSVEVSTATNGPGTDPDGYSLLLDGTDHGSIGVSSTSSLTGLLPGSHTVGLTGLAANCQVSGENPRTVVVLLGDAAQVAFSVVCTASGPATGILEIATLTTGPTPDPDGYLVAVDGGPTQPIGNNATVTLANVPAAQHSVELSGIAASCAVVGENPQSVNVAVGATAAVGFVLNCSAQTGSVEVVITTSGPGTDPDGFSLLLDGADQGSIGVSATSSLTGLLPGSHTVGLTGMAANCQLSGENPRTVTVLPGGTAQVAFAVACTAPGPATGSLEIATVTTGPTQDPDGYLVSVDGGRSQPIGTNATATLANVSAAEHTVELLGLAANCQLSGENPRAVTIPAAGTGRVAFAVTCTAAGPTTGSLEIVTVTTGPAQDANGYLVSVDGGATQPIGTNATVTLSNVPATQHTVQLRGLAANCGVTGDNPLGVAVDAGATVRVSFSVTCLATAGALGVTILGLPDGTDAAVTVDGPNDFSEVVTRTDTLEALTPGSYEVSAENVTTGGTTYTPSVGRPTVPVVAGATAEVTVTYNPAAPVSLNLNINGLYITQSTQTYEGDVPLVAGRPGFLRVFVVADRSSSARPSVRVRLTSPGAPEWTRNISAPPGSTPTRVQEGDLESSWNLPIPGSEIRPGLSIVAEVDPDDDVEESNNNDNRFPASGTKALATRNVPAARIRFISVQQGSSPPGDVSDPNRLIDLARRMHPLNEVSVDVDPTVFPTGPLSPNGDGWGQMLSDLDGKRVAEGTDRIYFGVVKLGYGRDAGLVGLTLGQGVPTAAGWDDVSDATRVVAHELGHVWGRRHSPCGNPPDVGPYPYPGGQIGVYGMDVSRTELKRRASPDIMSYCFDSPWTSDYTYTNIMDFRGPSSAVASVVSTPQPSMLVWGRLVNGQPVLEPAFHIVARPNLPKRPGPYSVSATAVDGSRLFTISFDVVVAEDGPAGTGHFAFTVPLDQARATRLHSLRLQGPTGGASSSRPMAQLRTGPVSESIVARREGENVSLRWNAAVHPMIMVRDPDTGEVLSFARGGTAVLRSAKAELDLDVSDGVRSQRVRLAISRW